MSKLNLIRHGQEISSEILNNIIRAINSLVDDHTSTETLSTETKTKVDEFEMKLDSFIEEKGELLNNIPDIQGLIATYLALKNSTLEWEKFGSLTDFSGFGTKIVQCRNIELSSIPNRKKQLIFVTDTGSILLDTDGTPAGRKLFSSAGEITVDIPTISIGQDINTGDYLWHINGEAQLGIPVQGMQGAQGPVGPEGPRGLTGLKGDTGDQGPRGPKGNDGSSIVIDIAYANSPSGEGFTTTYNNHSYIGIRTYLDSLTDSEIRSIGYKFYRCKGDTLYPHYDEESGMLTFANTIDNSLIGKGAYIKGSPGPQGPEGPTPDIAFADFDGDNIVSKTELRPLIVEPDKSNGLKKPIYYFDAKGFKGAKGDTITILEAIPLPNGKVQFKLSDGTSITTTESLQGEAGATPTFSIGSITMLESYEPAEARLDDLGNNEYKLRLRIPKAEKGATGKSITDAFMNPDTSNLHLFFDDGTSKVIQNVRGPQGPRGADGTSVTILGSLEKESELDSKTDMIAGHAYLIGENLYVYTGTKWSNLGQIKGPGIKSIKHTNSTLAESGQPLVAAVPGATDTYTIEFDSVVDPVEFKVYNGKDGTTITSEGALVPTTNGLIRTYTLNLNNGKTISFTVKDGEKGDPGATGPKGTSINPITKGSPITKDDGITYDTYTITYTVYDGGATPKSTELLVPRGKDGGRGPKGDNGKTPTLQKGSTAIEWKYEDDASWTSLVPLEDIRGSNGEHGNKIFWGTGNPNTTKILEGIAVRVNDMYFDTATGDIYRCESEEGNNKFTTSRNLTGPQGATGPMPTFNVTSTSDGITQPNVKISQDEGTKVYTLNFEVPPPARGKGIYAGTDAKTANSASLEGDIFLNTNNGLVYKYQGASGAIQSTPLMEVALSKTHIKRSDFSYDETTGILTINNFSS